MSKCRFCGRPNENNPGDHYHYHSCWQADVNRRIRETNDPKELSKLKRELEQARYVGD